MEFAEFTLRIKELKGKLAREGTVTVKDFEFDDLVDYGLARGWIIKIQRVDPTKYDREGSMYNGNWVKVTRVEE